MIKPGAPGPRPTYPRRAPTDPTNPPHSARMTCMTPGDSKHPGSTQTTCLTPTVRTEVPFEPRLMCYRPRERDTRMTPRARAGTTSDTVSRTIAPPEAPHPSATEASLTERRLEPVREPVSTRRGRWRKRRGCDRDRRRATRLDACAVSGDGAGRCPWRTKIEAPST